MAAKSPPTVGENVIEFIETFCVVPEGDLVGQPVKLAPFQKAFILAVYDNPHGTDTAILSMGRKNAKTGLIAFLVLVHLVSPLAVQNSRIISGALSKEQAAEVFNLASKCVMFSEPLSEIVRIVPSGKKLIGIPMNVEYQAISADNKTAHGKSPIVAILDEVGQIVGAQSDFVDAITTSQGAYKDPLLIYISTQAQSDADFFSIEIDDALINKPPKTVCHLYTSEKGCDVMDEEEWLKSNPAMGLFRSKKDMIKQAGKASRLPSFKNTFRNLNLNQRVSTNSPFINDDDWKACAGKLIPMSECTRLYSGLDLSNKNDLTANVFLGEKDGIHYVYPFFWMPERGLKEKADRDRAPYVVWADQGFLLTTPRATIDYGFVAKSIVEESGDCNLEAVAFDRWRIDFFIKEMDDLGIELPMVKWGQGFRDMSPAVEALEDMVLNRTIVHGNNPVLNMCMSNAMTTQNPAGDRKLDKMKTSGRIDGTVALAQAAGVCNRGTEDDDIDDFINNMLVLG